MTDLAKLSRTTSKDWIASSQELLAMTSKKVRTFVSENIISKKKSRALALLEKLCRPYFPENLDLILIDGATPLVRVRAPPETWTTRL
jgi:hypothetical protein